MNFVPSPTPPDRSTAHVAIVGNQLRTMLIFRRSLIRRLVAAGHRVSAICPPGSDADITALEQLGAAFVPLRSLERGSVGPLADLALLLELVRVLRERRPTHLFCYFLKPAVYGSIAGALAKVPRRVALIEGLGFSHAASSGGWRRECKRLVARLVLHRLLKLSARCVDRLIVLNQDDESHFIRERLVAPEKLLRIDGIGVDLEQFSPHPPQTEPITFTFVGRLIAEKGIGEFIDAARALRQRRTGLRFVVLGAVDANPSSISFDAMADCVAEGVIEWPGHQTDVRPWLAQTSVLVLPSRYGEGMPRSIMEAMSMARPVITSAAVPGCRDSVIDGVTGFLVQVLAPGALERAMARFVDEPSLIASMGSAARIECVRRFGEETADGALIDTLMNAQAGKYPDLQANDLRQVFRAKPTGAIVSMVPSPRAALPAAKLKVGSRPASH